ncbi:MAG: histidine phosphatase family protein [Candidatus Kerfeldbacteria bacterium]|nr:histidine phosphatase family protein [Candidatus Kerfeldbacteria bacterium]
MTEGEIRPPEVLEEIPDHASETREQLTRHELGRITLLRHGQTKYTEQYPDLTTEGQETIRRSAEQIAASLNPDNEAVAMFRSEAVRAAGTADIIKSGIGHDDEVRVRPSLNPMIQHDPEQARQVFEELLAANQAAEAQAQKTGSFPMLDKSYLTDPRFENAEIYEPRSNVEHRLFRNIEYAIRAFEVVAKHPELKRPHLIGVSHYELLGQLANRVFGLLENDAQTLKHGEPLDIRVLSTEDPEHPSVDPIELEVSFRGQTKTVLFDRKTRDIVIPK